MKRALLTKTAVLLVTAASCGGPRPEPATVARPPAPAMAPRADAPPRWVASTVVQWIERVPESGVDRVLVRGRRVETRASTVLREAKDEADFDGATIAPPWTTSTSAGAPSRYVFWREKNVYAADTWLGEARLVGTLPAPVLDAFDWLDGTGLSTAAGAYVVPPAGGPPRKLDLPGVAAAIAADARRALVITAFGRARLTTDGGASFRDVSDDLAGATELEVRGDDIHVHIRGDENRLVDTRGAILSDQAPRGPARHEPPPDLDSLWPTESSSAPLEAVAEHGLRLPDGSAIAVDGSIVARIDLATGRVLERFDAARGENDDCEPIRVKDGLLLVCESPGRATVSELTDRGRVERTFDLPDAPTFDRFVVADGEALGFVGPCEGPLPGSPADVVATATPTNASSQRSPVFCVRKGPGAWVEHRLAPEDASDVVAWIPRAFGGATALVALPGTFVHGAPRVSVRDSLRVVRVARNVPPLDISTYGSDAPALLAHSLIASPDGTLTGWIPSSHGPSGLAAVTIDPEGRAAQHPFPARTTTLTTAGRFALARTEDDHIFETVDHGRTFRPIPLPPSGGATEPYACSEVGCRVGAFIRIGWGGPEAPTPADPKPKPPQNDFSRALPAPPLTRLACHFAGPGEGKRINESFGLGFTTSPMPRMAPGRVGFTGALMVPWNGPQIMSSGDAEIAFVPLFDLGAPVVRATIPMARLGPIPVHLYEIRLGYLLDGTNVKPFTTSTYGRCAAPLLDEAGLTLPIGGCVPGPAVGVTLGSRALLLHGEGSRTILTSVDLPPPDKRKPAGGLPAQGVQRELATQGRPGAAENLTLGAGVLGRAPVAVAVDAAGDALLSPIDPDRGSFGPETRLAPLATLALASSPRCAPAPDDARIVLPFETTIGLAQGSLPGVTASGTAGLAVLRWSPSRACLEAVEIAIRDERHEADLGYYDPPGTVRKLVARFDGKGAGKGTLVVLTYGSEVRQPLTCDGIGP